MKNEKFDFEVRTIKTYISSFIKNKKPYTFKDLVELTKKKYPEFNSVGVKVNTAIEEMEKMSLLYRMVKDQKVCFLSTEFFEECKAIVEWQNKNQALIYLLDEKGNKTGEIGTLTTEESECVISGDVVLLKRIPLEFKNKSNEYILLERLDKATDQFIGKVVEIEQTRDDKIISKCVLLEKNFRFPIILDIVNKDQTLPYFEGDFIKGKISSDSEFVRGEDLIIDLTFVDRIGNILDPQIETKLAVEWMNIQRDSDLKFEEHVEDVIKKTKVVDLDRVDLTDLNFISIDGADSRDLDDAIFAKENGDGWNVLVAISDVSYYIQPNTPLNDLILKRDQSYYFPHKVYPMLPAALSEHCLSLNNDGENKKVLIVDVQLSKDFQIKSYEIYPALIRNKARLTYSDVDFYALKHGFLDETKYTTSMAKKYFLNEDDFVTTDLIEKLLKISASLKEKRGGDKTHYHNEFTPILDGYSGKVSNLKIIPRNTLSGSVVEECMLLCNVCAANFMKEHGVNNPIFRNQLAPIDDEDQLSSAEYSSNCVGHYALSFDAYTHFTSPMRRSVDLRVHREIRGVLSGNKMAPNPSLLDDLIYSNKVSRRFKQAQDKAMKWLIIEYLKTCREKYFKSKIIRTLSHGWIVECNNLKLQAYIQKPKDQNEVEYLESKEYIIVELHDIDFCKERLNLKIKTDKII